MRLAAAFLSLSLFAGPVMAAGESCEAPALPDGGPVCRHSEDPVKHLLRVLEPLWKASRYGQPVNVYFLNSVFIPNAVAMAPNIPPNKENIAKIGLTVGMWDIIQNDDELAFVLAHELAHLVAGDGEYVSGLVQPLFKRWEKTKDYQKTMARLTADENISTDQAATELAKRFARLYMNPKKRDVEKNADINAMNLLAITDSDNDGEPDFDISAVFSFLDRVKQELPEEDVLTLDSDHPTVTQRETTLEGVRLFLVGAAYFEETGPKKSTRPKAKGGKAPATPALNALKASN